VEKRVVIPSRADGEGPRTCKLGLAPNITHHLT